MDNFKLIYKILHKLEENMGNEDFVIYPVCAKELGISFEKWEYLLIALQDEGYIRGLGISDKPEDISRYITDTRGVGITIKGLEYLDNNPLMLKVKKELGAGMK